MFCPEKHVYHCEQHEEEEESGARTLEEERGCVHKGEQLRPAERDSDEEEDACGPWL